MVDGGDGGGEEVAGVEEVEGDNFGGELAAPEGERSEAGAREWYGFDFAAMGD